VLLGLLMILLVWLLYGVFVWADYTQKVFCLLAIIV